VKLLLFSDGVILCCHKSLGQCSAYARVSGLSFRESF
jgi:hypothetical protein